MSPSFSQEQKVDSTRYQVCKCTVTVQETNRWKRQYDTCKSNNARLMHMIFTEKEKKRNYKKTYPAMNKIKARTHKTHWYAIYFDLASLPGGRLWRADQPNWGRINKMNPRRKPVRNPPMCAKLSTCGSIPSAKLIAIMVKRVNRATACKSNQVSEIPGVFNWWS